MFDNIVNSYSSSLHAHVTQFSYSYNVIAIAIQKSDKADYLNANRERSQKFVSGSYSSGIAS